MQAFKHILRQIVTIFTIAMAGCGPAKLEPTPDPPKPHAGQTVKVACSNIALSQEIATRAKAWSKKTGVEVAIVGKPTAADVVIVSPVLFAKYAAEDQILPVPSILREFGADKSFQWDAQLVPYQSQLVQWGPTPFGVAILGEGFVGVYRTDKFQDRVNQVGFRNQTGRDITSPNTWEDVAEIAKYFFETDRKPSLPSISADSLRDFYAIAACYDRRGLTSRKETEDLARATSFIVDSQTGEPRLTQPAFTAAFDWFRTTAPYRYQSQNSPLNEIVDGSAVFAVLPLSDVAKLPRDKQGMIESRFGICSLPGTRKYFTQQGPVATDRNYVPFYGWNTQLGIVRKAATSPDAAWALLAELAGPEGSLNTVMQPQLGSGPLRDSQIAEQSRTPIWQQYGFDAKRSADLGLALFTSAQSRYPAIVLRTPDGAELEAILRKQLENQNGNGAAAEAEWKTHDSKNPNANKWRLKAAGRE